MEPPEDTHSEESEDLSHKLKHQVSKEDLEKVKAKLTEIMAKNRGLPDKSVVEHVAKIFRSFVEHMLSNYPDLADTCRDIFRDIIMSARDKDDVSEDKKGKELEVIKTIDFAYRVEEQTYPEKLKEEDISKLNQVFSP